ncbi:MAG: hypothetical protein WBC21_00155 [Minisyncoccales bacterium]
MTAKIENCPRAFILPEAKQKMDMYIQIAEGEISGLGKARQLGRDFLAEEVFIFEQDSDFSTTELDSQAVSKWLTELVRQGKNPAEIKLWWHSHDRDVFWSQKDNRTIDGFANKWMLSIVGNKRGDYLIRLDLYEPIRLTIDGLSLEIYYPENKTLKEEIEKEIKAKVKIRIPELVGIELFKGGKTRRGKIEGVNEKSGGAQK